MLTGKTKREKGKKKALERSRERSDEAGRKQRVYPIPDHIPVYPFAVEAWKLAARMGEKEDWSLVRVLTKLVRDCSLLGYYTLVPKPGRPCQAKPSAAPRHYVPRKHPDDSEKKERRSEERRG